MTPAIYVAGLLAVAAAAGLSGAYVANPLFLDRKPYNPYAGIKPKAQVVRIELPTGGRHPGC
jgi:hypothetical protein